MFQIVPNDINIDFLGKRKMAATASAVLVLIAILLTITIGPNYGIDFKGGSDVILGFTGDVSVDEVRETAVNLGFEDAVVQQFGSVDERQFLIQTMVVSIVNEENIEDLRAELSKLGTVERDVWTPEQPDRFDITFEEPVDPQAIENAATSLGIEIEVEAPPLATDSHYTIRFRDLNSRIRNGFAAAFPEKFDPSTGIERLETVGPRVGQQLRDAGFLSLIFSLLLILIYIAVRFDIRYAPGAVAALFHDVMLCIGLFVIIRMEINLPIVAALLTIIGYSLNDTIVVFDRIRENVSAKGEADLENLVNRSINETLSRTLITSLTTMLAVGSIFVLGGGLIKDFAFALMCGILVGTYSTIFVASPVMLLTDAYLKVRKASQEKMAAAGS